MGDIWKSWVNWKFSSMVSLSGIHSVESVVVFSANWAYLWLSLLSLLSLDIHTLSLPAVNKQKQFSSAVTWRLKEIFLEKITNVSHYSNFVNWGLKLDTGTPESIYFMKIGVDLWISWTEIVLVSILQNFLFRIRTREQGNWWISREITT